MASKRISILGASGHSKVLISAAEAAGFEIGAVFDDNEALWGRRILEHEIAGPLAAAREADTDGAVLATGDNETRKRLAAMFDLEWVRIVHTSTWIHQSVVLGAGTVVFAHAVIQPESVIGAHVIINTGATIDHECTVGDYAHVGPGSHLSGNVAIGEGAFMGTGSAVIQGVKIGAWSTVGLGAAVVTEIPDGVTVVGVPARPVER